MTGWVFFSEALWSVSFLEGVLVVLSIGFFPDFSIVTVAPLELFFGLMFPLI